METQKLYYTDAYLRKFTAQVLSCESSAGAWQVVLDRTAFYPEGGGQPADHGVLLVQPQKTAPVQVIDVQEKDGIISHICDGPLEAGAAVTGTIHWARRFDHMQQHSGEHILSGILCNWYHCDNVGFHLGSETVTIDYNAPITWEQALEAEAEANRILWADQAAEITFPSPAQLSALHYRSKKELTGQVRIVTFPEGDCCACCGTHVARAGQVGLVKILSCQKFREGVRLEILCGERAYRYLSALYGQSRSIAQRLSVKPLETAAGVQRLEEELTAAKARSAALEERLFAAMAREAEGQGNTLLLQPPMRPDSVRRLADAAGHACGGAAAVFSGEDGQYSYALVRGDGQDITPLVKELNQALHGRGGGRNGFAQGSVQAAETEIRAFFRAKGYHIE